MRGTDLRDARPRALSLHAVNLTGYAVNLTGYAVTLAAHAVQV